MTKVDLLFLGVFGVFLFIKWWFWLSPWRDRYWTKDGEWRGFRAAPTTGGGEKT